MNKFDLTTIYNEKRPLSWSALSSFEYRPSDWYKRYVLKESTPPSIEMVFGKKVGEKLADDPDFLPHIPRLPVFEQRLSTIFDGIPLVGYIDSFDFDNKKLLEYKTGRNIWDKVRADKHGQIDAYLLMLYLEYQIRPEEMECAVVWMPTHIKDGKVTFVDKKRAHVFPTKRTMRQMLAFGQRIKDTWDHMEDYAGRQHAHIPVDKPLSKFLR